LFIIGIYLIIYGLDDLCLPGACLAIVPIIHIFGMIEGYINALMHAFMHSLHKSGLDGHALAAGCRFSVPTGGDGSHRRIEVSREIF
jgi:hypothetical protein